MPINNVPRLTQKHSRIARKQTLENQESDVEIREAMQASSASAFVVSRLSWRLDRGLNTSKLGVL
jgi:hypothetical protein